MIVAAAVLLAGTARMQGFSPTKPEMLMAGFALGGAASRLVRRLAPPSP